MKVYIVTLKEFLDCETTIKILGIYSKEELAIHKVFDFEVNELDDMFEEDELDLLEVNNHNNGYLEAHLNDGFHEVWIDTKETELNYDLNLELLKI